jgi:hypothetical protein
MSILHAVLRALTRPVRARLEAADAASAELGHVCIDAGRFGRRVYRDPRWDRVGREATEAEVEFPVHAGVPR